MTSKALNSRMREQIMRKLISHRFDEQEAEITRREHEIAEKVWRKLVGQKNVNDIEELPDGWLPTRSVIPVDVQGVTYMSVRLARAFRVPDKKIGVAVQVSPSDSIGKSVLSLEQDKETLGKERRELREQIRAALDQFRTTKQLREGWPEAAEFLPGDEAPKQVPAVRVEELNAALGLRSAEAA